MDGEASRLVTTLVGNLLLGLGKIAAVIVTGSAALAASGLQSLADAGAAGLRLFGRRRAAGPAADHGFGPGRELYFWSGAMAVVVLAFAAGAAVAGGLWALLRGSGSIAAPGTALWVLGLGLVFEAARLIAAWRRKEVEQHSLTGPAAALAATLVTMAGVWLGARPGLGSADAVAAVAVGLLLVAGGLAIAAEVRAQFVGAPADRELIEDIIGRACRAGFVEAVNEVRTMAFGKADVLVNLSIDARDALTAGTVEAGIAALEAEIRAAHPEVSRIYTEIQGGAVAA